MNLGALKPAEGSVRDSLSLLDRALISKNIDEEDIDEIIESHLEGGKVVERLIIK